tara:strand:- start:4590 stop:5348 length:759 start_codon:yes stop_codon:yes gene_type:complete
MTSEEVEAIVNPEEETEDTSRIPEIISLDLSTAVPDMPQIAGVGLIEFFLVNGWRDTTLIHQKILEAILSDRFDLILAPEYSYQTNQPLEVEQYQQELKTATIGKSALVVPGSTAWEDENSYRDTGYVIFNGDTIKEQEKSILPDEIELWEHKGLRFGLEICSDSGVFKRKGERNLDVLLTPAYALFDLELATYGREEALHKISSRLGYDALRHGGIGIVNDSYFKIHIVYQKKEESGIEVLKSNLVNLERD